MKLVNRHNLFIMRSFYVIFERRQNDIITTYDTYVHMCVNI